jgi:class 3 adenylate cyclase
VAENFDELAERLTFTEIVRLQDTLSRALVRRFEKRMAFAFSDVVGSTPYFARFGDEAGRKLQQRHVDFCNAAIALYRGRIVDTAGDGAFLCFPTADEALKAMCQLQEAIAHDNDNRGAEHRLRVRVGVHFGPALTDGVQVSGDSVNFCSRVATSAQAGELRLSAGAFAELTEIGLRLRCKRLGPTELKGIDRPVELLALDWRDTQSFPSVVRFEDGTTVPLPRLDVVRFGRLRDQDGVVANDVVLTTLDPNKLHHISRWHFELHLRSSGYVLRSVSSATTSIDGQTLAKGEERPVKPGSKITVGGVLTLELGHAMASGDETYLPG